MSQATKKSGKGNSHGVISEVSAYLTVKPGHEEEARAGHAVTYEGASGYAFFVIEQGEARVMHGDEELRRLGPGDFFGEAAILGDGRRTADVVAETDLELLAMFGTRFRVLQMEMPELAAMIEATMRERLDR